MPPTLAHPPPRHVLLIHGAGGGGWEWNLWAPVLKARGFAVAAPGGCVAARRSSAPAMPGVTTVSVSEALA